MNYPADPTSFPSVLAKAVGGDTILLANGTYNQNLDATTKTGIACVAATPQPLVQTTVNGEPRYAGLGVRFIGRLFTGNANIFKGINFDGNNSIHPGFQKGGIQVNGNNVTIQDCIAQRYIYSGMNFERAQGLKLLRVALQENGANGYNAGYATDCTFEEVFSLGNNRGKAWSSDPFNGNGHLVNGLWYTDTEFEGGGGKIALCQRITFLRCLWAYSGGKQYWSDWENVGIVVKDCESHHAIKLFYAWDGQGFVSEADFGVTFDNCYAHDNGSNISIQLCEPANVIVKGCHLTQPLHVRRMTNRGKPSHDNSITTNIFYGAANISYDDANPWSNSVTTPNTYNAPLPATWKPGTSGGTGGSMNTPAGAKVDAKGVYWYVSGGQAYSGNATTLNLRPETNGIVKWDVVSGIFTQQNGIGDVYQDNGSGGWTKLPAWPSGTTPPPPGTDYHVDEAHSFDIISGAVKNETTKTTVTPK